MEWLTEIAKEYGLFVALVCYVLLDSRQRENRYIERENLYVEREKEHIEIIKSVKDIKEDVEEIKQKIAIKERITCLILLF